jgi:hypothetical protein
MKSAEAEIDFGLSGYVFNGVFGTQRRPYLVIDHDDFTLCFY